MKKEQESDSNQKELLGDKKNHKVNEDDWSEATTEDGELKPINKFSKSIHIKPADEQQFENNTEQDNNG